MLANGSTKAVLGRTYAVPTSRLQPAASEYLPVPWIWPSPVWTSLILEPPPHPKYCSLVLQEKVLAICFKSAASSFTWVLPGFDKMRHGASLLLIHLLPTVLEFQPSVPPAFHCSFFDFHRKDLALFTSFPSSTVPCFWTPLSLFSWPFTSEDSPPDCACTGALLQAPWELGMQFVWDLELPSGIFVPEL